MPSEILSTMLYGMIPLLFWKHQPLRMASKKEVSTELPEELSTELPTELLLAIFACLASDRRTLFSAMQVNSRWFVCCAEVLWQIPSFDLPKLIERVDDPMRRQLYVDRIRTLHLGKGNDVWRLLDLEFPCLKTVELRGCAGKPLRAALRCPSRKRQLQNLTLRDLRMSAPTLRLLEKRCQHLRVLELSHRLHCEGQPFFDFLQSLQNLRSLTLTHNLDATILEPACNSMHDGAFESLEELKIDSLKGSLSASALHMILARCTKLKAFEYNADSDLVFEETIACLPARTRLTNVRVQGMPYNQLCTYSPPGKVSNLSLEGSAKSIESILTLVPSSLLNLSCAIREVSPSICGLISRSKHLETLHLDLPNNQKLTREDLKALQSLKELQALTIRSLPAKDTVTDLSDVYCTEYRNKLRMDWLTDEDFGRWIQNFPELQKLDLDWRCDQLTATSVKAVANCCPRLKACRLLWEHDLDECSIRGF